ncbi:TPA: glutamate 5-kinase [Pasteurella multocida]|uniref:glutamate 5-kinase n=1 Tax=Pasteurella multocida TaxID=747 RepID=UPI0028DFB4EC|nr:glutamate 5-kinase [Pasteurella multocida]MEB3484189.1 glutamate 5-kinase [Pasteurella multocida]MEB3493758.1 glutamate 5-kinase [Pasteurella multocida]HDR0967601.1 glutamate 5-kinase [Pasteurella multocida]HDR0968748.1 glutamate 5-kinase [Pasteurella multocida]HDR0993420.1 glutamate 5-kinase [Pasteurella multocida]
MKIDKTLVVKFGTSTLTQGSAKLNLPHMMDIVRQLAQLHRAGFRLVIVTSGAIAAGRHYLNHPQLPPTIASKQLLAAVGQSQLIQTWEKLFAIYDIHIGQILLTRADIEDRERFLNARDTLRALLDNQIIPVINENDAVATSEIKVGDNDNLSALVAILVQAEQLYLLTDQQGLFDRDPRKHPDAKLIADVDKITDHIRAIAGGSGSSLGTGGMSTKINAADVATRSGIETIIAPGNRPNVIVDLAYGQAIGTKFSVQADRLESRKQWLYAAPSAGIITIDAGAKNAMLMQHKSLLPAGIVKVEGRFSRGEVVKIRTQQGKDVALGMPRYNSDALHLIQGKRSQDIEQVLGYEYGAVAVHRDDMIVL